MDLQIFVPSDGAMPCLEKSPTLLQKPIAQLRKMPCVAGVISGIQQADLSTMLLIRFKQSPDMDYSSALKCFNVEGLKAKFLQVNPAGRFIKIKLFPTKSLLN